MHQMHMSEDVLKSKLRQADPHYVALEQEHRKLDDALMRYELHVYLSPEDEQTRRELQKRKLALKDQMAGLLRREAGLLN